jgi:hypothetical protein
MDGVCPYSKRVQMNINSAIITFSFSGFTVKEYSPQRHSPCGIAARYSTGQEFAEFGVFFNSKLFTPRLRGEPSGSLKSHNFQPSARQSGELIF